MCNCVKTISVILNNFPDKKFLRHRAHVLLTWLLIFIRGHWTRFLALCLETKDVNMAGTHLLWQPLCEGLSCLIRSSEIGSRCAELPPHIQWCSSMPDRLWCVYLVELYFKCYNNPQYTILILWKLASSKYNSDKYRLIYFHCLCSHSPNLKKEPSLQPKTRLVCLRLVVSPSRRFGREEQTFTFSSENRSAS